MKRPKTSSSMKASAAREAHGEKSAVVKGRIVNLGLDFGVKESVVMAGILSATPPAFVECAP